MRIPVADDLLMSERPHLSVVIPAYREERRLQASLPVIRQYLERCNYSWEVVLVDDGSPDRTSDVARDLLAGVPHQILRNEPNAGKGASIRRGMLASQGNLALFTDADLSTPIEDIERLLPAIEAGADVAFGSRAVAGSELSVRQPLAREMSGRVFNLAVRLLVIRGVCDTQCGFKLFTRRAADFLFPLQTMAGFAFDVELLGIAQAAGLRIQEVGVRWENSPGTRVSLAAGMRAFTDLVRVRRRIRQLRREGALGGPAAARTQDHA